MRPRSASPFEATAVRDGGDLVISVVGDVDMHTAPRLRAFVQEAMALDAGTARVVVDLGDVPFLDSSGMGALLASKRIAEGLDAAFCLRRPSDRLRSLLRVTALERILAVVD